jgi:hypothetical protein
MTTVSGGSLALIDARVPIPSLAVSVTVSLISVYTGNDTVTSICHTPVKQEFPLSPQTGGQASSDDSKPVHM